MGDHLWAGTPPWYVTKPTRSTQILHHSGVVKSSTSFTWLGKGGNITSIRWQVTLSDPILHVSSRSGEAVANCCNSILPLQTIQEKCFTF